MSTKLNVVITGATGMVGEGVLHECLLHNDVGSILVIGRKTCGTTHPKLREILHTDFYDLSGMEEKLAGYNACFFCLGVSSVGMKEPDYYKLTHTLTLHFAETISKQNSNMIFCYISGAATDSTEKGNRMWARVKGKTENDLLKLPFKQVFNFRPGILEPTKGLNNTLRLYKYFGWLAPVIRLLMPNQISTLKELGLAMINAALKGYEKQFVEVSDIHFLAKK